MRIEHITAALLLGWSTLTAQTPATYATYGNSCNGTPAVVAFALNDQNPALRTASSLPNEYGYPVINTATVPVQVVGFEVWTRTNTAPLAVVHAGLHADAAGAGVTTHSMPAPAALADGMIEVANTEGWYQVALSPPVVVQPAEAFWIALDAFATVAPPQSSGSAAPATIHYRRPTLNGNAWTPSVSVSNPIIRVHAVVGTPAAAGLSASAPPSLGGSMALQIDGGGTFAPTFMFFAFSNTSWLGLPIPVDLAIFGAPECAGYTSGDSSTFVLLNGSGSGTLNVSIPNNPALAGFSFYNQAAIGGAPNTLGFFVTNAGKGTVGS